MRTVRSFDPCLPCGVHMYLGKGKVLKKVHSPTDAQPRRPRRDATWTTHGPHRTSGPSATGIERAARRAAGHRRAARATTGPRSCCGWSPSCTARAWPACVELVRSRGARRCVGRLADDELVASLLVVHGLHPDDLADAGRGARSTSVRPFLGGHGGDVELLGRRRRRRRGAPAPARQLRRLPVVGGHAAHAVERAIVEAAPEIVIIDVEEPSTGDGRGRHAGRARPQAGRRPYDPATGCGAVRRRPEPAAP